MQNSELFRRGFVVPLNIEAERELAASDVHRKSQVEFFEIHSNEVFEHLSAKGLFDKINAALGTLISDYEEERIEPTDLGELARIVAEFKNETNLDIEEAKVVNGLEHMIAVAADKRRSIFFIL